MSAPASPASPIPAKSTPSSKAALARRALLVFFLFLWIALVGVCSYQWIRYADPIDASLPVRIALALLFLAGPLWVFTRRLRGLRNPTAPFLPASITLAASVVLFLGWLTHDDAEWRHAERHPALRNDFPEAAATHALTLRYSQNAPGSLLPTLPETKLVFPSADRSPTNDAKWADFLSENGPALDALWTELTPLRAWLDELAAAPALGDLTEDFESPFLGFKALRLAGNITCARALQLAAEGRRDEAAETLLPVLIASQKLEPHARTLVRRMIAISLRRKAQNTLGRILDGGALSPATRDRLAALLAPRADVAEQARLLPRSEYETMGRLLIQLDAARIAVLSPQSSPSRSWAAPIIRMLLPFTYNARRSANIAGDYFERIGNAAAQRDHASVAAESERFSGSSATLPGKNLAGRLMLAMALPAFEKVIESYWKADDERAALLARLTN